MCLSINPNLHTYQVAEQDIPIYKFVFDFDGELATIFIGFHIKLGEKYQTPIGERKEYGGGLCMVDYILMKGSIKNYISEGFHTFHGDIDPKLLADYYFECMEKEKDMVILKGFIPKGSTYVYNDITQQIISDSVLYTEKAEIEFV